MGLVMSAGASAVPIVNLSGPRVAVSILNLDIGGTLYDVTWEGSSSFVFGGDALTAANAINAALNTTTADLVDLSNAGTINNYNVYDSSGAVFSTSYFNPGAWHVDSIVANPGVRAIIHQAPGPATLLLVLAGLGGIGLRMRPRGTSRTHAS